VKKFVDLKQKIAIMQKLARSVLAKKTVQTAKQERLALAVQGELASNLLECLRLAHTFGVSSRCAWQEGAPAVRYHP
jgi:hypothetical protein